MKQYNPRLKTTRHFLKYPDEVDGLIMSSDEKYHIFEFDPTVGDDNLVIYTTFTKPSKFELLVNIIPLLD